MQGRPYCVRIMSECDIRVLPNSVLMSEAAQFLASGMEVLLPLKGNSMLPFIRSGKDLALLRKEKEVREGDVVLALDSTGQYVIHRVIKIDPDGNLTLKGDGNLYGTENCGLKDVLGTVIEVRRPSGKKHFPSRVKSWQKLPVLLRRVIIAVYRRMYGQ